ncbi:hypothetical protein E2N92_00065 [Methanofollis formosanus]|uniref:Uncharacterized protein n=1 Tax=Methanofollis formosanus TaxID=299308 RepID=A0A8G0ZXY3_9EURY|nr:hypothetical protein [Methanofollis formosanus]QYZ77931.1 hypothetical protein E2N92_00065 [Methanofollis formosanus]
MKTPFGYYPVIFLLVLLFGAVTIVSAADPVVTVSCNDSFSFNGLVVSEISVVDLADPEVTWIGLESTSGCDLKMLTCPQVRYITRDCPSGTFEVDGCTVTATEVGEVDWSGYNVHAVYKEAVIPTISAKVPGETGNVLLLRIPPEVSEVGGPEDFEALFAATDRIYLYTEDGIVFVNPQTNEFVLWGGFAIGSDPNDFGTILTNSEVDLDNFSADPTVAKSMGDAHSNTVPSPGEYLCLIFRYEQENSAMKILGSAPVVVMDTDRAITWNGGAPPQIYTDGGDVALGFEEGNAIEGLAYIIFKEDAVFDAEMGINIENLMALQDHPMITQTCFLDFLMQEVPGHSYEDSPVMFSLIVDGETQGPDDLNTFVPISTGYGVAGAEMGSEVIVPAEALGGLKAGTYQVILYGTGENGSVVAVDQTEFTIGSNAEPRKYSSDSEGGEWSSSTSSEEKSTEANEGAAGIETLVPKSGGDGVKTPGGSTALKDVRIGEGYSEIGGPDGSDENAGNVPAILGYAALGLIALAGIGIVLSRGRFR